MKELRKQPKTAKGAGENDRFTSARSLTAADCRITSLYWSLSSTKSIKGDCSFPRPRAWSICSQTACNQPRLMSQVGGTHTHDLGRSMILATYHSKPHTLGYCTVGVSHYFTPPRQPGHGAHPSSHALHEAGAARCALPHLRELHRHGEAPGDDAAPLKGSTRRAKRDVALPQRWNG